MLRAAIAIVCVAVASGCSRSSGTHAENAGATAPSTAPIAEEAKVEDQVKAAIDSGAERVFEPAGPPYEMPAETYDLVRQHPTVSLVLLEKATGSVDPLVRANAYDFIIRLAEASSARDRSLALLRRGLIDNSSMVRELTRNGLKYLHEAPPPTTRG